MYHLTFTSTPVFSFNAMVLVQVNSQETLQQDSYVEAKSDEKWCNHSAPKPMKSGD